MKPMVTALCWLELPRLSEGLLSEKAHCAARQAQACVPCERLASAAAKEDWWWWAAVRREWWEAAAWGLDQLDPLSVCWRAGQHGHAATHQGQVLLPARDALGVEGALVDIAQDGGFPKEPGLVQLLPRLGRHDVFVKGAEPVSA